MESELNFRSASSVSLDELAVAFNAGFEGYFHPINMTVEVLSRRVRMEHIDLSQSFLAEKDGEFVGFALLGLRGREAWCGGLGVASKFRRSGFGRQVMAEFVARARGCGATNFRLEVLTRNTSAIRLYEFAEMRVTRDLLILDNSLNANRDEGHSDELKEAAPSDLLKHYQRLHPWQAAWQRGLPALLSADCINGVCFGVKNNPDAYALYVTRPDGVVQLIDLAAAHDEHARALSSGLTKRFGTMRVVNEPEKSLFTIALLENGFEEVERQHEMACPLS